MEFMDWSKCNANLPGYNGPTLSCIFLLIQVAINWLLTFAGVFALVLIIISGIRLITSGGDPKSVESGKKTFTYAVAGLIVILLSFLIVNLIAYATGVSCLSLMGFEACSGR